jgi:hypothetical protein
MAWVLLEAQFEPDKGVEIYSKDGGWPRYKLTVSRNETIWDRRTGADRYTVTVGFSDVEGSSAWHSVCVTPLEILKRLWRLQAQMLCLWEEWEQADLTGPFEEGSVTYSGQDPEQAARDVLREATALILSSVNNP